MTLADDPLAQRFPGLAKQLPQVSLGTYPTPVEQLPQSLAHALGAPGDLWVKRDDVSGRVYGGNKIRKLEVILARARARGAGAIWTTGALGSHHALATAIYATRMGLEVAVTLYPQPITDHVTHNLDALRATGARIAVVSHVAHAPFAAVRQIARLTQDGLRPMLVAPGGSDRLSCLGYVKAGLELAAQVRAGDLPRPRRVLVAAGTLGTAAGLAVGLMASGLMATGTRLVAVAVVEPPVVSQRRLRTLVAAVGRYLNHHGGGAPVSPPSRRQLVLEDRCLGAGYGHATVDGLRAVMLMRRHTGITLEPTYTGKALAALSLQPRTQPRHDGGGVDLFWNTVNSRPLGGQ